MENSQISENNENLSNAGSDASSAINWISQDDSNDVIQVVANNKQDPNKKFYSFNLKKRKRSKLVC